MRRWSRHQGDECLILRNDVPATFDSLAGLAFAGFDHSGFNESVGRDRRTVHQQHILNTLVQLQLFQCGMPGWARLDVETGEFPEYFLSDVNDFGQFDFTHSHIPVLQ